MCRITYDVNLMCSSILKESSSVMWIVTIYNQMVVVSISLFFGVFVKLFYPLSSATFWVEWTCSRFFQTVWVLLNNSVCLVYSYSMKGFFKMGMANFINMLSKPLVTKWKTLISHLFCICKDMLHLYFSQPPLESIGHSFCPSTSCHPDQCDIR